MTTWSIKGTSFAYAALKRIYEDYQPTLSCNLGDIYILNVGLITADEVMYAGGKAEKNNMSYYLYNGQNYWTMSPYAWIYNHSSSLYAEMFYVNEYGQLASEWTSASYSLRPVLNLRSDTLFKEGTNGTIDNPYVVI